MSIVASKPSRIDRAITRAIAVFDECRANGKKTFDALIPARNALKKYKLTIEGIDKGLDALHEYANEFFDVDYPDGTFGYSANLPG